MLEGLSVFFGGDSHRVARDVHDEPSQNDEHVVFITGASGGILTARLRFNSLVNVREFSLLPSAKQTRWLVPLGVGPCTSSGLDIYAPHKFVARGWKQLLAIAMRTGWTGWARRKLVIGSRRPLSLELLVNEVTGEANPVFALSLGTPNRFRKLTIQIMNRDGEVVGYAKLAITREAEAAYGMKQLRCSTSHSAPHFGIRFPDCSMKANGGPDTSLSNRPPGSRTRRPENLARPTSSSFRDCGTLKA